jgi:hypothetical protein
MQAWSGPPLPQSKAVEATASAVRALLKVAPAGLHVLVGERNGIVVAREGVGAVLSFTLMEETPHAEKWHAVEWSHVRPCPLLREAAFVARHEMLSWIMDRFLSMRGFAHNDK